MPHDVIMPALGMAQDTGRIIAWHTQVGDDVSRGDVLLEIETDKTTMEVEAAADGVLAAIYGEEGADIPVGDIIAVIAAPGEDVADRPASAPQSEPDPPEPASMLAPRASASVTQTPAPRTDTGRILASPKARRLAGERGIALADMAAAGVDQPIHVQDMEAFAPAESASGPTAASAGAVGPALSRDRIVARVPAERFDAMRDQISTQFDNPPATGTIWAAFAAGALRAHIGEGVLVVEIQSPDPSTARQVDDPDRIGFSRLADRPDHTAPALVIRDLSAGRILEMQFSADTAPVVSVRREEDDFIVCLEAPAGTLAPRAATGLVNSLLDRLENPLRHML